MLELNASSSIKAVQQYLESHEFEKVIRLEFQKYNGKSLLGIPDEEIFTKCGNRNEGVRLVSLLNYERSNALFNSNNQIILFLIIRIL
jgi:hypothetical protein